MYFIDSIKSYVAQVWYDERTMNMRGIALVKIVLGIGALGLIGVTGWYATRAPAPVPPVLQPPKEIRWLLGRGSGPLFDRAAEVFSNTLSKETNGSLILRIVKPSDLGLVGDDVTTDQAMDLLKNGSIEMATLSTTALGYQRPSFWAFSMPYLFATDSLIGRTLDSDITTRIFATLDDSSARGLALTLDGGFRVVATKKIPIRSEHDLVGKKIITHYGPVAEATLRAWGAVPLSTSSSTEKSMNLGTADGVETTYTRLALLGDALQSVQYINEVNHGILATLIVVQNDFFGQLSPMQQEALKRAAQAAAHAEREDALASASTTRGVLASQGVTIIEVSQQVRDQLRTLTAGVAPSFSSSTDPSLIQGLEAAQH